MIQGPLKAFDFEHIELTQYELDHIDVLMNDGVQLSMCCRSSNPKIYKTAVEQLQNVAALGKKTE